MNLFSIKWNRVAKAHGLRRSLSKAETGTGKELIAHALHNAIQRCGRAFIKLNCAAIPLDLLESELFGHEKGAFTGAIAQKIGRFEMADKGTLFLDEVGDIPPALQPKLLRVLQEQEFERLGSGRTHKVDVRLLAATNRNLLKMVARGQFRQRSLLSSERHFPILLLALRERREDIPALVAHFVKIFNGRMGKQIDKHSFRNDDGLPVAFAWPGNIRASCRTWLNVRSSFSRDGVLPNHLLQKRQTSATTLSTNTQSFTLSSDELGRLRPCSRGGNGKTKLRGWIGRWPPRRKNAKRWGSSRTTLLAKMRRLGVLRPSTQESTDVLRTQPVKSGGYSGFEPTFISQFSNRGDVVMVRLSYLSFSSWAYSAWACR